METLEQVRERRNKIVRLGEIDYHEFEGTLDEAIDLLENLRPDEESGFTDLRVTVETDFGDYDDGYAILIINGHRPETDEEIEVRVDAHSKEELRKYLKEQEKIEGEKLTYLQLKEKYEKELG